MVLSTPSVLGSEMFAKKIFVAFIDNCCACRLAFSGDVRQSIFGAYERDIVFIKIGPQLYYRELFTWCSGVVINCVTSWGECCWWLLCPVSCLLSLILY